jgi:hypothetical protein
VGGRLEAGNAGPRLPSEGQAAGASLTPVPQVVSRVVPGLLRLRMWIHPRSVAWPVVQVAVSIAVELPRFFDGGVPATVGVPAL